jgi:hypothetical protein
MAGKENLIPNSQRSPEELRENGRKGGKASGKVRRKKKLMREQMELLLSLPLKNEKVEQKLTELGIYKKDMDNQMALIASMFAKGLSGDVPAATFIRDTIGEKPVEMIGFQDIELVIEDEVKIE